MRTIIRRIDLMVGTPPEPICTPKKKCDIIMVAVHHPRVRTQRNPDMCGWTTPLLTLIIAAATVVTPCRAAILNVPADYPDIASALAVALPDDEVVIAPGTYLEHDLILPSGVVLRGATGNPADVVIDGERAGRCIYGTDLNAASRIEALTLSNGLPALGSTPHNSWGGGLMVDGGALSVANCVFTGNETAIGGGAFVTGTEAPTFIDCVFDGNEATESAGLLLNGICNPLVQNCVFRNGDRTMVGGGMTWAGLGHALIEDCTVEDNVVWETGGGVEVFGHGAVATLRRCLIRRNSAGQGAGGLSVGNYGHVILENCQIVDNEAEDYSGGINLGTSTILEATETTILGNAAPTGPDGGIGSSASATLTCCVIDVDSWNVLGSLTLQNDGCGVAAETLTWGAIKAIFR